MPSNRLPNLLVFGLGHSGTSVLTKMLYTLGWHANGPEHWTEKVEINRLNVRMLSGDWSPQEPVELLARLTQPWCIKNPQFVRVLEHWMEAFRQYTPAMIWIRRDPELVIQSHLRRGAKNKVRKTIWENMERAQQAFDEWPWMKIAIDYDQLRLAVSYFDIRRSA